MARNGQRLGDALDLFFRHRQDMEGEPVRRLPANAGKLSKMLGELFDGFGGVEQGQVSGLRFQVSVAQH